MYNGTTHATDKSGPQSVATLQFSGIGLGSPSRNWLILSPGKAYAAITCLSWDTGSNFTVVLDGVEYGPYSLHVPLKADASLITYWSRDDIDATPGIMHTLQMYRNDQPPEYTGDLTLFNLDYITWVMSFRGSSAN